MIFNEGVFHGKRVLTLKAIREVRAGQVRGAAVRPGNQPELYESNGQMILRHYSIPCPDSLSWNSA